MSVAVAYTGVRRGETTQVCRVLFPDQEPLSLEPLDYAGFDWGNRDSVGAHALAYALLLEEGDTEVAHGLHDDFLDEIVQNLAPSYWYLPGALIGRWCQEKSAAGRRLAALA